MDSGNLMLLDDDEQKEVRLWESFENPSDTFLPGMKMDSNLKLTSWKSADDPGSGNFTFKMEQISGLERFMILNFDQIYWESEEYGSLTYDSKIDQSDDISSEVYNLLINFSLLRGSKGIPMKNYDNTRLFLDSTGMIQWVDNLLVGGELLVRWNQPKTKCFRYDFCGNFASCNDDDYDSCKCLPGFYNDYSDDGDTSLQDKLSCARRKSASCTRNDTVFLNLTKIKTGIPDRKFNVEYEENCTYLCLGMCPQCQAYSYAPPPTDYQRGGPIPSNCWIWTHNLTTLKEDYTDGDDDHRLFVLVDKSDIGALDHGDSLEPTYAQGSESAHISFLLLLNKSLEPTPRTCEPCGTNMVPYPLSTGSNCGDLKYFNFICNTSTGQLNFTTSDEVSYRVIRVNPISRTFTIYNEDSSLNRNCGDGSNRTGNLKVSSPFHSDNWCSQQVEVSWDPPSEEPVCDNSVDCQGWKSSTCSKGNRCVCNANYRWNGESLSCTESFLEPTSSPNATIDSTKGNSKSSLPLILSLTLTGVVILACIIIFAYRKKTYREILEGAFMTVKDM
ncbi:hypothetical protein TSUD_270590 [Trifolium subterraneum]|uniref:Apple domain-containing protein n=1 Tax=Trifolium subterraneum TaxID=3900 RepID=A0A2Z6N5W6_TRISU|nr:hypothetical protein TSUD_270590 [Trifolium subterraneum]